MFDLKMLWARMYLKEMARVCALLLILSRKALELTARLTPGWSRLRQAHDGSRFPEIVSVTALGDDQSAIIGYLLIGADNTARKQVEAEQQLE